MKSPICEKLGIEFPLIAFTHCRDVVVEVSKAGGMGVLGAAGFGPDQLEIELAWIDEHIDGKPYGLDLIVPTSMANKDESKSPEEVSAMVPDEHKNFAAGVLARHNVDTADVYEGASRGNGGFLGEKRAEGIMDIAFAHPISLIVNALGVPPAYMLQMAKEKGVLCGALVGAKHHAIKQAEAGVEILIVSGTEAGGHCGEVSTMVLVPEVSQAVEAYPHAGCRRHCYRTSDGSGHGYGGTWGLDRFRLVNHPGGGDVTHYQGKIALSWLQPNCSLEESYREIFKAG